MASFHTIALISEDNKQFCRKCGSKLKEDTRVAYYDTSTGRAIFTNPGGRICPNHPELGPDDSDLEW